MANHLYDNHALAQARYNVQTEGAGMPNSQVFTESQFHPALPSVSGGANTYDRGAYLQRLSDKYGAYPDNPSSRFHTRRFIRPYKQENLRPEETDPIFVPLTMRTLPIPGNPTDDRLRRTIANSSVMRHRSGMVDSAGRPIKSFARGQIVIPPQTKFEVSRTSRYPQSELLYGNRLRRYTPIYGRSNVQNQHPRMNRDKTEVYDDSIWKRRFATRHFNTQTNNINTRQLYDRQEHVVGAFIDSTISAQAPQIGYFVKDDNAKIERLVPYRKRKGLEVTLNRRPTPANTQYTGASYYFRRGPGLLADTQRGNSLEGLKGYTPPWGVTSGKAPEVAFMQDRSQPDWARDFPLDRTEEKRMALAPDMYQHDQEFTQQSDRVTQISKTLAPQILVHEPRTVQIINSAGVPNISSIQALEVQRS